MSNRIMALAAMAAALFVVAHSPPARAEVQYPWCAEYTGNEGDNGVNCGFVSLAQCRLTISGAGGYCYQNPAYEGRVSQPRKNRKNG